VVQLLYCIRESWEKSLGTSNRTLKWPEAPARRSAASTGGAWSQCWNVYARAGPVGCVGRRDDLTAGDSRGTETEAWKGLAGRGPTEVERHRSCTAAYSLRSAARAGLATSAAPYGGAARDGLVNERELTGTDPSHLSATPVSHCVPVWKCSRGNGIEGQYTPRKMNCQSGLGAWRPLQTWAPRAANPP
jgi:hypothetical protein